jgi:hypothetical protein
MAPLLLDTGVVPGGEQASIDRRGPIEQRPELDALVAGEAGVGRATAPILVDEVVAATDESTPPLIATTTRFASMTPPVSHSGERLCQSGILATRDDQRETIASA